MENLVADQNPKFKFPTETIELPSKGLLYSKDSPLANGEIEMKYMTAKEEDILTNQNYIKQGTVLDKLLQALIVTKIDFNDLLIGDKNAIMVASRILGYGKDYSFEYKGEEQTVDLSLLEPTTINEDLFKDGKNEFYFTLPASKTTISFKFLTHGDERKIEQEIKGLKKLNKNVNPILSTRLKYLMLSVDGDYEKKTIREFIDNFMLARDSRDLRQYMRSIQPNIDLVFEHTDEEGTQESVDIPINVNFFWPGS